MFRLKPCFSISASCASELTIAERELIAAWVSAIKGCHYCFSAHRDHARAWGIPEEVFGDVEIDLSHPGMC